METKLGNLSMNRVKMTFDVQHQEHAASVMLHQEDEFLYAAFLRLISKRLTQGWMLLSSPYSYRKWGKEEGIQA